MNPIIYNDSYKLSHREQLIPGTNFIYSHLTPRFVKYLKRSFPTMPDKVIVYGLQSSIQMLQERWEETFFKRDWKDIEKETLHVLTPMLGYTEENISHFKDLHELGYLPLKFKTLPEGSHVNINLPVLTVANTHPDFPWLTNFVEPTLLNEVFKPMTVATLSLELSKIRDAFWEKTSTSPLKDFALHDFSFRGHSGQLNASSTVSAYLLYTKGTDTMSAVPFAQKYYDAGINLAGSISAFEHSTATLGVQFYKNVLNDYLNSTKDSTAIFELSKKYKVKPETFAEGIKVAIKVKERLLDYTTKQGIQLQQRHIDFTIGEAFSLVRIMREVYPKGYFAYVSDSYNYGFLLNIIVPELKDIILSRDGKFVIRPDSGNPVNIIAGYKLPKLSENALKAVRGKSLTTTSQWFEDNLKDYEVFPYGGVFYEKRDNHLYQDSDKVDPLLLKGTIQTLEDIFGTTVNEKGYKELPPQIGLVYGDGINYKRIEDIYTRLEEQGFAISNVVLSGGAFMLANHTRDSLGFAIKASLIRVDDIDIPVFKEPFTDLSKASKAGLFKVVKEGDDYILLDNVSVSEENEGELKEVWKDGKFTSRVTFTEIQSRLPY